MGVAIGGGDGVTQTVWRITMCTRWGEEGMVRLGRGMHEDGQVCGWGGVACIRSGRIIAHAPLAGAAS